MGQPTVALRSRANGILPTRSRAPADARPAIEEDPEAGDSPKAGKRPRWRRWAARIEAVALAVGLVAASTAMGASYVEAQATHVLLPGIKVAGIDVGGLPEDVVVAIAAIAGQASLDRPMTLVAGEVETTTTARALGAVPVPESAVEPAVAVGRTGHVLEDLGNRVAAQRGHIDIALGYRFDEARALARLVDLAPEVDRPSLPTRLDLEARKVEPARPGAALLAYDSLSSIAVGLARGADRIELVVQPKPPVDDPLADIADRLDVSIVVGSFDTPYSTDLSERDRNHNLEVGSAAIDGLVLMPGEQFSFNETVGPRSAEAGYRYATGITSGQLVDVLGGGICQVSSTLFGAAFFAGLEIVAARPHSRPSNYVDMGLDSTVVYPTVDLVLRNPYDFPVVFHMKVSQGKVRAEVLGPRRPYQIAFERELQDVLPYKTIWREDDRLRLGTEDIVQGGRRGFKLERRRKFYQAGELTRTEKVELSYPPTTEILRRGTSPSGEVPEKKKRIPLRDPAAQLRLMQ
jgi:vancomycin resistance protein YoaR